MTVNLKGIGVKEMLAQRVIARLDGDRLGDPGYQAEVRSLISAGIGGFILFGGNYWEVRDILPKLLAKAKVPLIIASDMERGVGHQLAGGTEFPCQMALAAAVDLVSGEGLGLVSDMAEAVAYEARAAGVNAVLAPVLDVNSNPHNPIICTRAYSDEPKKVSVLGEVYISGLQGGKTPVMACAKHYPGHGDAALDSHTHLPRLEKDKESIETEDMLPFRKAVMGKVEMVMTGHLLVQDIDPEYPASLSRKLTKDYLRTRAGFDGLILTDALNMGALCRDYSQREAARLAIKAGADILLHPSDCAAFLAELSALADEKGVTKEEVMAPASRLTRAKTGYCANVRITDAHLAERMEEHRGLAQLVAERALTLVKAGGAFPRLGDITGKVVHVALEDDDDRMAGMAFRSQLKKRKKKLANVFVSKSEAARLGPKAVEDAKSSQLTILSVFSRVSAGKGHSGLSPELLDIGRQIIKKSKNTAVISFASPYVLRELMDANFVVAAYDPCEAVQNAAVRAFFGEIFFRGQLPVRI
jgi:beta-glucosidase-like glycosyl hydrolase